MTSLSSATTAAATVAATSELEKSADERTRNSEFSYDEKNLKSLTNQQLYELWRKRENYICKLERDCRRLQDDKTEITEREHQLKSFLNEAQQRERLLIRKLAVKEQEMQDFICQLSELKSNQIQENSSHLNSTLLDPSVNLVIEILQDELKKSKIKVEDTQSELTAWKFTPDSNTGKRLMTKCRLLHQENEELGKLTTSGRLAKLETELALQKSFADEMKKSQQELDEFLQDLDDDVEGMQSTIYLLQQELRMTKDAQLGLQNENNQLKTNVHHLSNGSVLSPQPQPPANNNQHTSPPPPPPPSSTTTTATTTCSTNSVHSNSDMSFSTSNCTSSITAEPHPVTANCDRTNGSSGNSNSSAVKRARTSNHSNDFGSESELDSESESRSSKPKMLIDDQQKQQQQLDQNDQQQPVQ